MDSAYYLVESGLVLEVLERFRQDCFDHDEAIREWARSHDIESWKVWFDGHVCSVKFKDVKQPEGFKKPDKHGCSEPMKKNVEWLERLASAPVEPKADRYLTDVIKCPTHISYTRGENKEGFYRLGGWYTCTYQIGWYSKSSPMCVVMPDVEAELREFDKKPDGRVITDDIREWVLPNGMRKILKEEWELMRARHKQESNNDQ